MLGIKKSNEFFSNSFEVKVPPPAPTPSTHQNKNKNKKNPQQKPTTTKHIPQNNEHSKRGEREELHQLYLWWFSKIMFLESCVCFFLISYALFVETVLFIFYFCNIFY